MLSRANKMSDRIGCLMRVQFVDDTVRGSVIVAPMLGNRNPLGDRHE